MGTSIARRIGARWVRTLLGQVLFCFGKGTSGMYARLLMFLIGLPPRCNIFTIELGDCFLLWRGSGL